MFANSALVQETDHLKRFALKLTQNMSDAEDLLQATVLRAIEKKHLFKKDSNLFSWTSRIMYNLFVSAYRRKVKFESQYDPENYIQKQKVEPKQDLEMEIQDLDTAINKLSDTHREILIMVCVKEMQYAEVAEKLDIPVGTVRSRLSRARASLQEIMDDNYDRLDNCMKKAA